MMIVIGARKIIAFCIIIEAIGYIASILSFFGYAVPAILCYISIKNVFFLLCSYYGMRIGGRRGLLVPLLWLYYHIQIGVGFLSFCQKIKYQLSWG